MTLEQLERHIKDTNKLTDRGNVAYCNLLESLRELATIWKIRAKTIIKLRPIDNLPHMMAFEPVDTHEQFCICQQPENGSTMISCDFCDMWYHYTCIGLQDLKLLEKVQYKCVSCAIRQGLFWQTSNPNYAPVMPGRSQVFKELA